MNILGKNIGPFSSGYTGINFEGLCRHLGVFGATGGGKTTTVKQITEILSENGIPVFLTDVKGDLSNFHNKSTVAVDRKLFPEWKPTVFPANYIELKDLSTTVTDLGVDFIGRMLSLNNTQVGVLSVVFTLAEDLGLHINTLADLKAVLIYASKNTSSLVCTYGNITQASIGVIQRGVMQIEKSIGAFFNDKNFDINNLIKVKKDKGVINVLRTDVVSNPTVYAAIMLWMLEKLYNTLPEIGDTHKPKLVIMIDEAHVLFSGIPKKLLDKVEQIIKLIRSKGVGVIFISQDPSDIPESILAQVGGKILHVLRPFGSRAFSILKMLDKVIPSEFFVLSQEVIELGTGEAIISLVNEKGMSETARKIKVAPSRSL